MAGDDTRTAVKTAIGRFFDIGMVIEMHRYIRHMPERPLGQRALFVVGIYTWCNLMTYFICGPSQVEYRWGVGAVDLLWPSRQPKVDESSP